MKVPVTIKLNDSFPAKKPWRKRVTDAGYDLSAAEDGFVEPGGLVKIRTGLHLTCPPDFFYRIESRSSLLSDGIFILPSIIDSTYTGELIVLMANLSSNSYSISVGDRIAQVVFYQQVHMVEYESDLNETDGRGADGWESSGLNNTISQQPE